MSEHFSVAQADLNFRIDTHDVRGDVNALRREFHAATSSMSDDLLRVAIATEKRDKALLRFKANSTQAKQAELELRRAVAAATAETRKQERANDANARSLSRLARGAVAGSGAMRGFGRQVAFASSAFLGGAGLTAALVSTLRVAGEFQQALNILQAVTKATGAELAAASDEAKRLGRDIRLPNTSAKDAAQAMTELAKSGFTVQQAMAAARGTLALSAAAAISVGDAAKITSRQINAFKLSADEASRVADVLANAANAASGEIPDMALAFSQASTIAKRSGLSIEDTAAALGVLANNAIIGSDAGTSLRVMLTRFIPVSVAAAKEMDKLGLSAFNARGEYKPLRQVIEEFGTRLQQLTPKRRADALQTIFGQDAQRAANILLVEGAREYDKLRKAVTAQGGATTLAAARNRGYIGSLDAFKSAVETLQISVGQKLLPTFTEGIRDLTRWVNRTEKSGDAAKQLQTIVEDTVDAIRGFVRVVDRAHDVLEPLVDAVGGFGRALEIAFGVALVVKLRKVMASFGLMATSADAATTRIIADAGRIEAALDAATRPRNVVITTTGPGGTGVPGGGAPVPTPTGTGGGRAPKPSVGDRISPYGRRPTPPAPTPVNPASGLTQVGGLIIGSAAIGGAGVEQQEGQPAYDPRTGRFYIVTGNARIGITEAQARTAFPGFYKQVAQQRGKIPGARPDEGSGVRGERPPKRPTRPKGKAGGGVGDGLTPSERDLIYQTELERLRGTPGTGDERRLLEGHVAYVTGRIRLLEKIKNKTAEQRKQLKALYELRNREQAEIDQIIEENRRKEEERDAERRRKAEKEAAARRKRQAELDRARKRDEDAVRKALDTRTGPYANTSSGFAGGRPAGQIAFGSRTTKTSDAATKEDIARAVSTALAEMISIQQRYAPNFEGFGLGKLQTHAFDQVTELRNQTQLLAGLAGRGRYPDSDYGFAAALGAAG